MAGLPKIPWLTWAMKKRHEARVKKIKSLQKQIEDVIKAGAKDMKGK